MQDIEWAYYAGLVDGEGCISVYINGVHPQPNVCLGNTYLPMIDDLIDQFGGCKIHMNRNLQETSPQNKSCYMWRLTSQLAMKEFLAGILPYLRVKQHQARLALELIELLPNQSRSTQGKHRASTDEELLPMFVILGKIQELNKKGRDITCIS